MTRLLKGSFVIARRDFTATVLSKAFIFFLLGPLFPLLLGGLFGGIGARVAQQTERTVIAVIAAPDEFQRLHAARDSLAGGFEKNRVVETAFVRPKGDNYAQARDVLRKGSARAVLIGGKEPLLVGSLGERDPIVQQLGLILRAANAPEAATPRLRLHKVETGASALGAERAVTAQIGQMLLFFLTILLSGMLLSQLIEEKSNKIIEVIAAAVPIDAMFVGKLFAMLAASVVGIIVWVGGGALAIQFLKQVGVATLPSPALGWPAFLVLGVIYFAMNYLLLGAVFLTIGAQASTAREVQTLSMPATFGQVLIFGFAATAIGTPNSPQGIAAAIFPLSSPMAMLARAAEDPAWWPHLAAILWQVLWVGVIIWLGARLFRKTVLKSGPARKWWRLSRA